MGVGDTLTESEIDDVPVIVGVAVGVIEMLPVFDGLEPALRVLEGVGALVVEVVGL